MTRKSSATGRINMSKKCQNHDRQNQGDRDQTSHHQRLDDEHRQSSGQAGEAVPSPVSWLGHGFCPLGKPSADLTSSSRSTLLTPVTWSPGPRLVMAVGTVTSSPLTTATSSAPLGSRSSATGRGSKSPGMSISYTEISP